MKNSPKSLACSTEVVKQAHVAVAETLEGEGLNQWRASVDRIQQLGFEQDQAEHIVGQAFGWVCVHLCALAGAGLSLPDCDPA